jgi:transcriptional regulator with XRE-family HTH domain
LRVVISRRLQEWMRNSPAFDTQAKLAEYSGVSQTTIGRVLHEQTSPTIDTLECLAKTFGRDVVDLVSRPDAGLINMTKLLIQNCLI